MKHWIGRQVIVYSDTEHHPPIIGILRRWDSSGFCIVGGTYNKKIYFRNIRKIEKVNGSRESQSSSLHSVGYIMNTSLQFDNAIYFKSFVMIWNKDELFAYGVTLMAHDNETVTLSDDRILYKDQFQFVVRSLRSKL
ncbi:hypothetical protein [Paenibacillus sp. IHBB 10380]|uniref:hypothetical protein n=1 Tax=Paenibacillus sp. IHBB 10380 TaxID=1566358 RepID=UPI0005CFDD64|nr:hypothetical protein [Paenibacillus sp. IHBB 10380]AJS57795.1 hypothetical protein UB51_04015 [Paenibacillus sp. IHBB 10380]